MDGDFGYGWVLRVQSVTGVGVLISPSAPVSGTGTGFDPMPSRERGIWLMLSCSPMPPCGYCLKASMTGLGFAKVSLGEDISAIGRFQQIALFVSCEAQRMQIKRCFNID